ncbi:TolC family protein [Dethiosulfatarculus sandiegensis]|uniref:TolC family protein n=1 Tax=Dethiosulfatarculus sandiegensis TaxID=1429043 RepID=UPI0005C983DE|nr:TolC family protein [Dethiosulfatarculus sandiegensis]
MRLLISIYRFLPVLLLFLGLAGCLKPGGWPVDQAEYDKRFPQDDYLSLQVPAELKPEQAQAPSFKVNEKGQTLLSLEQAAYAALRGNQELTVRQFAPVQAGAFEKIERGVFSPELFADFSYGLEKADKFKTSSRTWKNEETTETLATAGVRRRFASGTNVEISAEGDRTSSSLDPDESEARLGLSITQSLLRGLGPVVNLVAVRQAELKTRASLYELRGFTEATLAQAEIAYWEFVQAEREIAIFKRSLEVAQQQLLEIEQRIEVGMLPQVEAAAARAEVARREQATIEAESNLEDRRLRLLRIINPGGGLGLKLVSTSRPDLTPRSIKDIKARAALARKSRPDLNEARLRLKENRLQTIATKNGLLPRLDLFVSLGKTGYAQSLSNSFSDLDGSNYDAVAGVKLSHYLDNLSAEGRHTAALASARQARAALDNLNQQVELDVRLALNQVERARRQIFATRLTRELQEKTVFAEIERFDVGKSTSLLVAQAQRDLLASQINEVQAIVYYRIGLVRLYLAEGSLLQRRGVSVAAKPSLW